MAHELKLKRACEPAVEELRQVIAKGPVTLVYRVKDTGRNHAVALTEHLQD
jgi:uncharacterized protein YeaO (DUF488 family)